MQLRCVKARAALAAVFLAAAGAVLAQQAPALPPDEAGARARLNSSPRHGEWVTYDSGSGDKVDAWVVYPERSTAAPVVIVVHEIYGLTDWVRSVADQFAAEGFIAVAPDLLTGKGPQGGNSSSVDADGARALIAKLDPAEITRRLDGAVTWAIAQPSAAKKFAVVGYCWGGGVSFAYATVRADLSAAAVFYGVPPSSSAMAAIRAPVLAFYGGSDDRVTSTAAPAAAELKRLGKSFDYEVYPGAGHAFLRQQGGMSGSNLAAAQKSWPRLVRFFKDRLEGGVSALPAADAPPAVVPPMTVASQAIASLDSCCGP